VLGIVILVALQVARIATFALFQVLLPVLFTLLNAPGRRGRMLEIGHTGQRRLHAASQRIRHHFLGQAMPAGFDAFIDDLGGQSERTAAAAPRQRVSIDAEAEELAASELEHDVEPGKGARR
jgi:hypothetical protein